MVSSRRPAADLASALRLFIEGEGLRFRVRGRSMEPALGTGDMVRVTAARLLLPGDLVLYRSPEAFVVHRLLGWYRSGGRPWLLTQGDAVRTPDFRVSPTDVVGRVGGTVSLYDRLAALARFVAFAWRRTRQRLQVALR